MFFKINEKVLEKNKKLCLGAVVVKGVDNVVDVQAISGLLKAQVAIEKNAIKNEENLKNLSELKLYNEMLKSFNVNSAKYLSSVEALLKRVVKDETLPNLNPMVNLANYISIKYKLPVGTHDIDTLDDEGLEVRLTDENDLKNSENSSVGDDIAVGEVVYASGNSVRTRKWVWRQLEAGRINQNAVNIIFPIDGMVENKNVVSKACSELASLLEKFYPNAVVRIDMLDCENPQIKLGELSKEELEIENTIKIMLKGVADYTPVAEIRAKLRKAKAENRPLRIKLGLDPSAPDIHIGHSVVLRKIRQLQELGHHAVMLIGDYTGRIGDPTGKSKTRKQLSEEDIMRNAKTYQEQIFKVIDKDKAELRFNSEWLSALNFGDVIDLAATCTVARMLERDDFKNRYENHLPLSVHEFLYPLMQGYDSVALNADIEMGGTDQTFNILMGRNIQRHYGQEAQLTLFMPLLEGLDGVEKMSKSLGNYIGINEEPHLIYEKVMKVPDNLIIKYYNLCTDLHPDEVDAIQKRLDSGVNPRDVKMELALNITELYSSKEKALEAQNRFVSVFQKDEIPDDIPEIYLETKHESSIGEQLLQALIDMKEFKSKGEIKRLFLQSAAKVDGEVVRDVLTLQLHSGEVVLKIGKNKLYKLVVK